ncbi:MAG: hypothetical protein KDK70_02035 [Myxococcales bacterium]|nr:hypothetical protein [Myxococcales bacterium]
MADALDDRDDDSPSSAPGAVAEPVADPAWSRRGFGRGLVGATITSGLFAGCRPCFSPWPPREQSRRARGPRTFTMRAQILPGQDRALQCLLDDPGFNPFKTPANGIHYARLFITDPTSLYFMVIYDDYWSAIHLLGRNAEGIDAVFGHCAGYPAGGAADAHALDGYVRENLVCVELFYRAYDNTQAEVRDALALREHFLRFLRLTDGVGDAELRRAWAAFLQDPNLLNHDRSDGNDAPGKGSSGEDMVLLPANSPDRVNPFTLVARVEESALPGLRRKLELGTFATIDLGMRPLKNLPTLHFARVSIINGNQMLFASVYDGDFIQYVEDFSSRIAKQMDAVFGASVGYPLAGSRDVFAFKDFLRAHQVPTSAFGGGYLSHSLLQIKSSLALTRALARFERRGDSTHPRLAAKLRRFLHDNQNLLT